MNNKGFAVTAVIYGLSILGVLIISILMGTLSASRANVQLEANKIEQDLIAFNRTSVVYNRGENLFTVPKGETGWYRVEAFGASFADSPGAYTTGIIYLEEGRSIYVDLSNRGDNSDAIIRAEDASGNIIMRAAASNLTMPGGTLQAYSSEPKGGNVVLKDFELLDRNKNNLIGSEDVYYSNSGPISQMAGYPGSRAAVYYNGFTYYFVDGLMLPAANKGVSKVIITRLARKDDELTSIPRKNNAYNGVRAIKVYNSSGVQIIGLSATSRGVQYDYQGGPTTDNIVLSLNNEVDIDDVSIFFDTTSNRFVKNVDVIFETAYGDVAVYSSRTTESSGFTATPTGIKLSAYQLDYSKEPPKYGNYYLIPVLSNNKIVSARKNSESEDNPIMIEYIQGTPRQKWAITRITSNNVLNNPDDIEYYISEESRYKAMAIYHDENITKNRVVASMTFNNLSRNPPQIWNIFPQYDGTYAIKTTISSYNQMAKSGFLSVNTSRKDAEEEADNNNNNEEEDKTRGSDYYEKVMIGQAANPKAEYDTETVPTITERFYLYSLDFGNIQG